MLTAAKLTHIFQGNGSRIQSQSNRKWKKLSNEPSLSTLADPEADSDKKEKVYVCERFAQNSVIKTVL